MTSRIGRRFAIVAALGELLLKLAEVFDHAVVNEGDDVVAADVRVSIVVGRRAVRRPARVAEADAALCRIGLELLDQLVDAAGRLGDFEFAVVDRDDTAAVVAAVFQPAESFDEKVDRLIGADVSDDAAHGRNLREFGAALKYPPQFYVCRPFSTYPDSAEFAMNCHSKEGSRHAKNYYRLGPAA